MFGDEWRYVIEYCHIEKGETRVEFALINPLKMPVHIKCTHCIEHAEDCTHPSSGGRQKACDECIGRKTACDLQDKLKGKKRRRTETEMDSDLEEVRSAPASCKIQLLLVVLLLLTLR